MQDKPTVFPTRHILVATLLAMAAYSLIFLFYSSIKRKNALRLDDDRTDRSRFIVCWLLVVALGVRIALSCLVEGHKTDINCFTAWGSSLAGGGFGSFYNISSGMPDYPPGYMYVLGLMSSIAKLFGYPIRDAFGNYDLVHVAIIKLPAMIADLAAAYLVYRIASKRLRFIPSLLLMSIVAFNPLMVYISGGWGQIDQILSIFIVLAIVALNSNKPILGGLLYGLAILLKPQALMVGPLLALAYACYVFDPDFFKNSCHTCRDSLQMRLFKTFAAVLVACLLIVVSAIPFSTAELPWYRLIHDKYLGTATSYKYATVNAYNIFALFGKNWTSVSEHGFIGLSLGQLGTIGMIISVLGGGVLYFFGRKRNSRGALPLAAAFTFASLFTLGHYMHERYMFPVLLLLCVAYLYYHDKTLLFTMIAYTVTALVNCIAAFYYSKYHEYQLYWDKDLVKWCSLVNVLLFAAFAFLCVRIMILGKTSGDVFEGELTPEEEKLALELCTQGESAQSEAHAKKSSVFNGKTNGKNVKKDK